MIKKVYQVIELTKWNGIKVVYQTFEEYEVGYALQEFQNRYPKRKYSLRTSILEIKRGDEK